MLFGAGALISLRDVKKKRRHRLGSQSSQNVALGRRELIVRTLAQETRAPAINAASVEKMSQVLLGFAEPILDRLAPLDEKKAMLFFAITDYCMISSEEQRHMRWELRHILNNAHNRALEMLIQRKTDLYPRNRRLFMDLEVTEIAGSLHVDVVSTDLDRLG